VRSKITRFSGSNVTLSRSGLLLRRISLTSQPSPRSMTSHFCMIGTYGSALLAFISKPFQTSWRLRKDFPASLTETVRLSLYTIHLG